MKIFIGGVKKELRRKFVERFPAFTFVFADEEEGPTRWRKLAATADQHIVFQHRTTHKHIDALFKRGFHPAFTASIPIAFQLVEGIERYGKVSNHHYGAERG